jgi:hypothetical protein
LMAQWNTNQPESESLALHHFQLHSTQSDSDAVVLTIC